MDQSPQENNNLPNNDKNKSDVFGDIIDTSKNSVIINVYTKLNNKIIGFDIEEDGFTTTYYYLINENYNK